eukprot:6469230-Amphidinium_carterae.1
MDCFQGLSAAIAVVVLGCLVYKLDKIDAELGEFRAELRAELGDDTSMCERELVSDVEPSRDGNDQACGGLVSSARFESVLVATNRHVIVHRDKANKGKACLGDIYVNTGHGDAVTVREWRVPEDEKLDLAIGLVDGDVPSSALSRPQVGQNVY